MWIRDSLKNDGEHPLVHMIRSSDAIWEMDSSYRNPDLESLDHDLAELEGTPGFSRIAASMKDAENYFDHRASVWFAAKYKRAGRRVEFILESPGTKTPDLALTDDKTGLTAYLEVKHVGLKTPIETVIRKIQAIPSQYSVHLTIKVDIPYNNQAQNLARIVTEKIHALSESSNVEESAELDIPGVGKCQFFRSKHGERKMTGVSVSWPGTVSVPRIISRLSQLIGKAREQLTSYSPSGVNVICLYVDDESIKSDIAETTLLKDPGLFNLPEYTEVSAVKYVRQMIGHQEVLFPNERNSRTRSGELGSLGL